MESRIDDDRLTQLEEEARLISELCERHGELDGATAARSQARAFRGEIARRAKSAI